MLTSTSAGTSTAETVGTWRVDAMFRIVLFGNVWGVSVTIRYAGCSHNYRLVQTSDHGVHRLCGVAMWAFLFP